jgi:hypothetical protein
MEDVDFPCGSPPAGSYKPRPSGYKVSIDVPELVVENANRVLNNHSFGYGDSDTQVYKENIYLLRVEPHCDDHIDGILHWRRGVTVYQTPYVPEAIKIEEPKELEVVEVSVEPEDQTSSYHILTLIIPILIVWSIMSRIKR